MARASVKISVSLPAELKEQLDRYAQEHQHSVSQVVQTALEALLNPTQTPPAPPHGGQVEMLELLVRETREELQTVRNELSRTQHIVDRHRDCLASLKPLCDIAGVVLSLPPELLP